MNALFSETISKKRAYDWEEEPHSTDKSVHYFSSLGILLLKRFGEMLILKTLLAIKYEGGVKCQQF